MTIKQAIIRDAIRFAVMIPVIVVMTYTLGIPTMKMLGVYAAIIASYATGNVLCNRFSPIIPSRHKES